MAGALSGAAWSFWKNIKEISPRAIEEEAEKGFRLALIGTPEHRAWLKEALLTEKANAIELEDADAYLREYDETPEADAAASCSFLLYSEGEGEPIGVRGANGIPLTGNLPEIVDGMLKQQPKLTLALAKRFPAFRLRRL